MAANVQETKIRQRLNALATEQTALFGFSLGDLYDAIASERNFDSDLFLALIDCVEQYISNHRESPSKNFREPGVTARK